MKVYLAGPMSGIPQFNFPAFRDATARLRSQGFEVVSPQEEDEKSGIGEAANKSITGNPADLKETWGQILARDVCMLADDGIQGIVFLPDWQKSRGARLEAFVGLLQKEMKFFLFSDATNQPQEVSRHFVRSVMMTQFKYEEYGNEVARG
jgi:hypothetical protein